MKLAIGSILLLFVAMSSAKPLETHETGSSVKLYNIFALEKGIIVREDIEVNEKEDYEILRMPAHNGLDAVDILTSFKEKLTLRRFPEKGGCLVSYLDTTQFTKPSKLAASLDDDKSLWNNVPNITHNYIISDIPTGFHLPSALADFCGDEPLFLAMEEVGLEHVQTKGEIFIEPLKPGHFREKRQIIIDTCPSTGRACVIKNNWCHYIKTCKTDEKVNPDGTREEVSKCEIPKHMFGDARCCRACCLDAARASVESPACSKLKITDLKCPKRYLG